jgi:hypothetical protein
VSLGPVMAVGNGRATKDPLHSKKGMNSLLICKDFSDTCHWEIT